jgi:hypothetical protein
MGVLSHLLPPVATISSATPKRFLRVCRVELDALAIGPGHTNTVTYDCRADKIKGIHRRADNLIFTVLPVRLQSYIDHPAAPAKLHD